MITLNQLYTEAVKATATSSAEEEVECANVNKIRESVNRDPSATVITPVAGKTVKQNMGDDASVLGRELLQEEKILAIRKAKARMSEKMCLLRECIVNALGETKKSKTCRFCKPFKCHRFLAIARTQQQKQLTSNKLTLY